MKDYLISLFIDNELNLDEKIDFVETTHAERAFKDEAIALLEQEKMLHAEMVHRVPKVQAVETKYPEKGFAFAWMRPLTAFATGLALGVTLLLVRPAIDPVPVLTPVTRSETAYRFVIYRPDASQAEIIGTFTGWQPVPMEKMGSSGYWSLTLNLGEGEYQYSYVVEGGQQITDPTVPERVKDDFGGENSIITVKA